jgi:hypothetical protein
MSRSEKGFMDLLEVSVERGEVGDRRREVGAVRAGDGRMAGSVVIGRVASAGPSMKPA